MASTQAEGARLTKVGILAALRRSGCAVSARRHSDPHPRGAAATTIAATASGGAGAGRQARALLGTLNIECVNADELNAAATEAFRQPPDYRIITSFPGLGEATGARVLARSVTTATDSPMRGLKSFAGAAPITKASGRSISITHRHVKNNRPAAVGFVGAFAAIPRPGRSRSITTGVARVVTGTPRLCATSSPGS